MSGLEHSSNRARVPYYLCQTKGCEAYGKSIPRAKIEGEVGDLIKTLQPTRGLITVTINMFRTAWAARTDQAKAAILSAKRQINAIDTEIGKLVERIIGTDNASVIAAYETKLADLERNKALLVEKASNHHTPGGTFEEKLEPALTFLANPWKLWASGNIALRRVVLKLAFTDHITYC